MRRQRRRDTSPEVAIRRRVHAAGLRFRVDCRPLPSLRRSADIVFGRARVAVFVDGCFWHGCPEHGTWPKANADSWRSKIEANRARDADTNRLVSDAGWIVVRIWEHEDVDDAARRVLDAVNAALEALCC
jgi:DNA mismatch endonuclease, patch repair protein